MKTTTTTALATAVAAATTFLVTADCGMSNFHINTEQGQGTEKAKAKELNVDETTEATSRRDLRKKSSKDRNECDIATVQRAQLCADYTFKILEFDGDDTGISYKDFQGFYSHASSGGADREIQAAKDICGYRFNDVDLVKLAEAISNSAEPAETLTRLEYETEMVLAFCGNDLEGFKNATWILDDGTLPCRQRDQGHLGYLGWCFETVDLVKLAEAISNSAEAAETLTRLEYETEMVIAFYGNDLEGFQNAKWGNICGGSGPGRPPQGVSQVYVFVTSGLRNDHNMSYVPITSTCLSLVSWCHFRFVVYISDLNDFYLRIVCN